MSSDRDVQVLALIQRLEGDIEVARKYALDHTVCLLQMARLDLHTILHSISDEELRGFTEALDRRCQQVNGQAINGTGARPKGRRA